MTASTVRSVAHFFSTVAPVLVSSSSIELSAPVVFQIDGAGGGTWTLDFRAKQVREGQAPPPLSALVRANALDFLALVEGRLSAADGLLSERVSLAGDAAAIAALLDLLAPATGRDAR